MGVAIKCVLDGNNAFVFVVGVIHVMTVDTTAVLGAEILFGITFTIELEAFTFFAMTTTEHY